MYTRPQNSRQGSKGIAIPENYSGSAFVNQAIARDEPEEYIAPESDAVIQADTSPSKKPPLLEGIGGEEILILGLIFLLSQSDEGNDLLPILIILLFLKGENPPS